VRPLVTQRQELKNPARALKVEEWMQKSCLSNLPENESTFWISLAIKRKEMRLFGVDGCVVADVVEGEDSQGQVRKPALASFRCTASD
jgi:hypothetical protein